MARSRESKIELIAYDDLFEIDESRAEANLNKIREFPFSKFPMNAVMVLTGLLLSGCCKLIKKVAVLKEIGDIVANTLFELQKRC